MKIDGTEIIVEGFDDMDESEIKKYIAIARESVKGEDIPELKISRAENGEVALDFVAKPPKFERIRRITGYLVGSIDRWNNAKRAEEKDRVKHGLG